MRSQVVGERSHLKSQTDWVSSNLRALAEVAWFCINGLTSVCLPQVPHLQYGDVIMAILLVRRVNEAMQHPTGQNLLALAPPPPPS